MKNKIIILIGATIVLLIGFVILRAPLRNTPSPAQNTGMEKPGFSALSSTELASMLEKKDFFLVNVHIPQNEEIRGTDAFIAFDEIKENLALLPQDKSEKIVLYCRSGSMSDIAAQELAGLGYTNVFSLSGGMNAWKESGRAVYPR
ncbi:MAG: rhodanese-like domain-containing protein [Candidatus Azambacteria bacterium]|nr:rhodanese-like domain-containing protein [Candidatus Azambacteria bacterium]